MQCSYCQTETRNPRLTGLDLEICPQCAATFLPAKQWGEFKRKVPSASRKLWMEALRRRETDFQLPQTVLCARHGEPLSPGKLPGFGWEVSVAGCCDLMHLPPSLLARMLDAGLSQPDAKVSELTSSRRRSDGIIAQIAGFLFRKTGAEAATAEVSFDDILWETRIKSFVESSQ